MILHENRLPADDSHKYYALFDIFEKASKFAIVVCCKLYVALLRVNLLQAKISLF